MNGDEFWFSSAFLMLMPYKSGLGGLGMGGGLGVGERGRVKRHHDGMPL